MFDAPAGEQHGVLRRVAGNGVGNLLEFGERLGQLQQNDVRVRQQFRPQRQLLETAPGRDRRVQPTALCRSARSPVMRSWYTRTCGGPPRASEEPQRQRPVAVSDHGNPARRREELRCGIQQSVSVASHAWRLAASTSGYLRSLPRRCPRLFSATCCRRLFLLIVCACLLSAGRLLCNRTVNPVQAGCCPGASGVQRRRPGPRGWRRWSTMTARTPRGARAVPPPPGCRPWRCRRPARAGAAGPGVPARRGSLWPRG